MTGGFYGAEQIRELKERVKLVDVVAAYTTVKQQGSRAVCCCPLPGHVEKTPSCTIYEDGHLHCFGCNKSADAIELVMQREGCDFRDACELLARRVGMELKPIRGGQQSGPTRADRDRWLAAMSFAAKWYHHQLRTAAGAEALAYLHRRGFTDETIDRFQVGWAPGRGTLTAEAKAHGHTVEDLQAVGLYSASNTWSADFFFARITFPICDRFGNPVAFSARALPGQDKERKYVNSPTTALYKKESTVFNLHRARDAARTAGRLLVVEGVPDVLALAQAGIHEAVAPCGTALTPDQLQLMNAAVGDGRVVLLLNNDKAGTNAAAKVTRHAITAGIPLSVATLPAKDCAVLLLETEAAK